MRIAKGAGMLMGRRASDLLLELTFMEAQLCVLRDEGKPHRTRHLGERIAALHHRLDEIERRLRLSAGVGCDVPVPELRRRLALVASAYPGPERRGRRELVLR